MLTAAANAQQNVSFAWDAESDPGVSGYALHYGIASGVYTDRLDVGTNTTSTASNLLGGQTYYFAVTAYNDLGSESASSSEVSYTVPSVGSVTALLTPAEAVSAGAQWQLDGGALENGGVTLAGVPVGSHTVTFTDVSGWVTPATTNVTVSLNQNTTVAGTYTQVGAVQVTINPAGAVSAGAQWRLDGGSLQNSGSTITNLSLGNHTVTFTTVSGWATPVSQAVSVSANQTAGISGTYSQVGAVQVTINPSGAVSAGAQWQLDGGAAQSSGTTLNGLPVGNHTVTFTAVAGWTAPTSQPVTVTASQTAGVSGTYAQVGLLQVSITPAAAVSAGAQWQLDGGPFQASGTTLPNTPVGTHTVAFKSLSGWNTPASQTFNVAGSTPGNTVVNRAFGTYSVTETNRPTVSITSPSSGSKTTSANYTVAGSASDKESVTAVYCQLNGASWTPAPSANNWSNWTADVSLIPGTNIVRAYSVDTSGNVSFTNGVSFFYSVGASASVHTHGKGSLNTNYNGKTLEIGMTYSMTAMPSSGFAFNNWTGSVTTDRPTVTFMMQTNLTLTANFVDTQKPTVTFSSPATASQTTNANLTVVGKAADNVAVAAVYYQLNGSSLATVTSANNWSDWTQAVTLIPGTNVFRAYAVDTSGNVSPTSTLSVFYAVPALLTVQTNGRGTVSPNENGKSLDIGRNYTITATASLGFGFTGWTGGIVTNKPTITFMMEPNLALTANFVDTQKPTLTISSPATGLQTSNANLAVVGKASDNVAVAAAYYQLNGSSLTPLTSANNWSNWTANLTLTPGTNIFRAYSVDTSGNISATSGLTVFYAVPVLLMVQTNGRGTVTPNDNGKFLYIGRNYSMTATASSGFGFTNWTGSITTNKATITFMMESNLSFTANFVDTQKPTITFSSPATLLQTGNPNLTVIGKASDNVAVAGVYYQFDGSDWTSASSSNNWTNWTAAVTPTPGTNIFRAFSVDTTGNLSKTNSVSVIYETAPAFLNGLTATVAPTGGIPFTLTFGTTGFLQQSTDTNNPSGVGNYTYKKLSASTAQLKVAYTAPPTSTNDGATVLLTFSTTNSGVFTDTNGVESGTISLSRAASFAPASIVGDKVAVVSATGDKHTVSFGATAFTDMDDSQGGVSFGNYSFTKYCPLGALLKLNGTNKNTNYVILVFGNTNQGSFSATDYQDTNTPSGTDSGVFGFISQAHFGNAPATLSGLDVQVTLNGSTFMLDFGAGTFDQSSVDTNINAGVGTFTYAGLGSNSAQLNLLFAAPPTVTNDNAAVQLSFLSGDFAVFTNQIGSGVTNFGAFVLSAVSNVAPVSVAGKTLSATNDLGVVDIVQFNNDGTFAQVETGSSQSGSSSGTYIFTPAGPSGAMVQLNFTSPAGLAGTTAYFEIIFSDGNSGTFAATDYDNSGDPATTALGCFLLQ